MTDFGVTEVFPTDALNEALDASIAEGSFSDTAYYLFSRRTVGGTVGSPRAVYASSLVMKAASDHFRAQLGGEFSMDDMIPHETEGYSYEDDSDIEDPDDLTDFEDVKTGDNESSSKAASSADSAIEKKSKGVLKYPVPSEDANVVQAAADIARGVKHRIFIPDVAAATWHALVYYVYTGRTRFAPLKSKALIRAARACSPKSMYRLADITGLSSLKRVAETEIKAQLSEGCIVDELFSSFSSHYPDILDTQLTFLYGNGVIARVLPKINDKIKLVIQGQLPHAENLLRRLLSKLSEVVVVEQASLSANRPLTSSMDQPFNSTTGFPSGHSESCGCSPCDRRRRKQLRRAQNGW